MKKYYPIQTLLSQPSLEIRADPHLNILVRESSSLGPGQSQAQCQMIFAFMMSLTYVEVEGLVVSLLTFPQSRFIILVIKINFGF